MKKFIFGTILSIFTLVLAVVPVFAVGKNGDFENGTPPEEFLTLTASDNTNIADWTVDSGGVDYIGTYWVAPHGVRSIDMNALTPGSISQVLDTVVGATYNVTFDMSGNPMCDVGEKVLNVSADSVSAPRGTFTYAVISPYNITAMTWEQESYTFIATAAKTKLSFVSLTSGACGPALDNVVIGETLPILTPTNKDQCKKDGWRIFNNPSFKNQGQCVSFVENQKERDKKDKEKEHENEDQRDNRDNKEDRENHGSHGEDD